MVQLALAIEYHVALGILLAGLVWAVGAGYVLAVWRDGPAVFAYPIGLLAVLCASALFLLEGWLAPLSLALLLAPLVLLFRRWSRARAAARRLGLAVAWGSPAIVGLSTTLGFFLHGPTARVDSNAFGDVVWYVAKLASARQSLIPLRDLSAAGVNLWHAELGPTLIGAASSGLPAFDPFLFHTSTLPAFLGASLCAGFAALRTRSAPRLELALLAVGMTAYVSWFAESPPVTLALPLSFALFVLTTGRLSKPAFASMVGIVVVDAVLTKGLLLIPIAVLAAVALRRYSLSRRERLAVAIGVPLALVVFLVATLANSWWVVKAASLHFQPLTAYDGLRSQLETRSTIKLAPALQLVGYAGLAVLLARRTATGLLIALAVCVVWSWTVYEYSIEIGLGVIVLLSALEFRDGPSRDRALLALTAACLALGAWFRDFAGIRAALVECACLAALAFSALVTSSDREFRRPAVHLRLYAAVGGIALLALSGHALAAGVAALAAAGLGVALLPPRWVSLAAASALGLGCVAAAAAARSDNLRLGTYDTTILPSEQYEVWRRVASVVPADGLVFTDQTGPSSDAASGLNYYPAVAGRQVYLAGWYQSRLRGDDDDRAKRLDLNQRVLDGKVAPGSIPSLRRYRSFYAVLTNRGSYPPSFQQVYANSRFAVFRIPG
jgi:hypothetical protein